MGQLLKFWIGWEVSTKRLDIVVEGDADLPKSTSWFCFLKLPKEYYEYERFAEDVTMVVGMTDEGFPLIWRLSLWKLYSVLVLNNTVDIF